MPIPIPNYKIIKCLQGINYGMDTTGEKEKRTSKKNVDGRSTSSHDNKKCRTRSMEKQGGMAFGFRKTATAVIKPDRQITCLQAYLKYFMIKYYQQYKFLLLECLYG
jgi:hypothetical protein